MSRFKFDQPDPIGSVVVGDGKFYELEFDVPTPVGKFYGDVAIELLEIVNTFGSKMENKDDQAQAAADAFGFLRGKKDFWSRLLPTVLGYKDVRGKSRPSEKDLIQYFHENCTNAELIKAFMEASAMIVNHSFGAEETEEALAKLEGGVVVVEGEATPVLDGTM